MVVEDDEKGDGTIRDENGSIRGRYFADDFVKKETEEEKFQREQQDAINKLRDIEFPKNSKSYSCSICRKKDFPLFIGQDGEYYCREHILPENRRA